MLQFIFTTVLMLGIGTVLFLIARSLPRVGEEVGGNIPGFWEKLILSEIPEKVDAVTVNFMTKVLRRAKVVVLRLDNRITKFLERSKTASSAGAGQRVKFEEMNGGKDGGEAGS